MRNVIAGIVFIFVVGWFYQNYGTEFALIMAGGFLIMGLSEIAEQIESLKEGLKERN